MKPRRLMVDRYRVRRRAAARRGFPAVPSSVAASISLRSSSGSLVVSSRLRTGPGVAAAGVIMACAAGGSHWPRGTRSASVWMIRSGVGRAAGSERVFGVSRLARRILPKHPLSSGSRPPSRGDRRARGRGPRRLFLTRPQHTTRQQLFQRPPRLRRDRAAPGHARVTARTPMSPSAGTLLATTHCRELRLARSTRHPRPHHAARPPTGSHSRGRKALTSRRPGTCAESDP